MKFDFCIGNPPYQDNTSGENETFAPPVYDKFMDSAYEIADKVEFLEKTKVEKPVSPIGFAEIEEDIPF